MGPTGILLSLLGVLAAAILGLWQWERGAAVQAEAATAIRREQGERATRRWRGELDDRLRRTRAGRALETRLLSAGLATPPGDAALIAAAVAVGGFAAATLVFPAFIAALVAIGGVAACDGYVRWRLSRRTEEFVGQLPELARTLSNAASAGLALPSAVEMAANEVGDPAQSVLRRVLEELRLGQSLPTALARVEQQMPSREVGVMVSTLAIQQRAGGDVVQALRHMAKTLEDRKETAREVRTTISEAKQSGYMVVALGLGSVLLLNLINPGALDELVASWIGRGVLVVSLSLFAVGFLLIRRVTRIEL